MKATRRKKPRANLASPTVDEDNTHPEIVQGFAMPGGGWSCPHEIDGLCGKVANRPCDPGMKGCELYGRYVFFDASKNTRLEQKRAREMKATTPSENSD